MKKFVCSLLLLIFLFCNQTFATEETQRFGVFGDVWLYYQSAHPSEVVLFVSGDGGWNKGVVDMARALSTKDALVVGIDILHFIRELENSGENCLYPAGDFELLSKFVQQHLNYPEYITPILVGYSSGATLIYAALVQAPSNTFKGGISLGFCPDLETTKSFCPGNGLEWTAGPKGKGYSFLPAKTLEVPWIALQGEADQVCNPEQTEKYVSQVTNGEIIMLPKVGHGFAVQKNWMSQFKEAFMRLTSVQSTTPSPQPQAVEVKNLPLVEFPASATSQDFLAIHISGDGGYGVTDKGISNGLASKGIPVVGLNSLKYFWKRRTPDEASKDLGRILNYYLSAWKKNKLILIGYSMGADVLGFMVNRLPENLRSKIQMIVLLGPSHDVDFKFHLTNWLGGSQGKNALPVKPEVEKLKGIKILCFYGEGDNDTICPELDTSLAIIIPEKGGHRVRSNYDPIVQKIFEELK
ncbi:MAG TPA: AcvB/VirJ family lysyl-phosphatidylglycerol hydrolase [Terriglobales bacterium]|nr:AcvB/VirJ family lysyl-phosphatidylglycerol hydrolase [Terriglobales bacterium]